MEMVTGNDAAIGTFQPFEIALQTGHGIPYSWDFKARYTHLNCQKPCSQKRFATRNECQPPEISS